MTTAQASTRNKEVVVVDLYAGQGSPVVDRAREYKDLGALYEAGFTHALDADEDLLLLTHEPEGDVETLSYEELYEELRRQGYTLYELKQGTPVLLEG